MKTYKIGDIIKGEFKLVDILGGEATKNKLDDFVSFCKLFNVKLLWK